MPLKIIREDITKLSCDAIVNPTNVFLLPGGGTDAAIHSAAGEELMVACKKIGYCNYGDAKITKGYALPCKYVIHTVGPQWKGGGNGERALLESCYRRSLLLADKYSCKSIAFPLISSGSLGYPKESVLRVAIEAITEFLTDNEMTVYIVVYDKDSYKISEKLFADVAAYIDDKYVEEKADPFDRVSSMRRHPDRFEREERSVPVFFSRTENTPPKKPAQSKQSKQSLDEMLASLDESFAQMLFRLIDESGMSDVECYKRANVDKKTFSKIKCNKNYRPSKVTAISFAIALRLDLEKTNILLRTVGMSLSHSNKFDVIIEYFIVNGIYDIFEINETLFKFDQLLLGV